MTTGRTIYELTVEAPPGDLIQYHPMRLADALGIKDVNRLAIETNGASKALVTIYPDDPLAEVLLNDPEQLLMDARGRIWVGRYHNGRPALLRLYDPSSGSAQRLLLFGTTGAGKSTAGQIILAAMKRAGIAVNYADLKGGQSAPEAFGQTESGADGNTGWRVTTQEGTMAQLHTTWTLMQERQERYAAMGRSKFLRDRPDPLVFQVIDEANRLLEKGAPFRNEATFYIKDIGRTGRSLGIGIALFAQAGHLEEMGGSDTLRSMLKEGEVVLLRWTSSMMRQLVTDGLLPAGQALAPIPKYAGQVDLRSQFDEDVDDEDLPGTQGTGYLVNGRYPSSRMRFWRTGSPVPTDGLDPEILALYGDGKPAEIEQTAWDAIGEAYTGRLDGQEAYAAVFPEPDEGEEGAGAGGSGGGGGGGGGGRRAGSSAPARAAAMPAATRERSRTIADRVQAVLDAHDDHLDAKEVLELVNADGGREVKLGSVRNTLSNLRG
ncbi:transfer protein [Actinacidiphila sp. ITFR-21]|uniref:transfer protein n=1 Tax=Actinacidiphila sp. ITFR-21 TaxID=3075199 RepID=UPI00288BF3C0|nr:transfer protein [Streptomyces sp. ITFR-21]WNI20249.1 transfer protein [Streptomyces sp. ITFR-21]